MKNLRCGVDWCLFDKIHPITWYISNWYKPRVNKQLKVTTVESTRFSHNHSVNCTRTSSNPSSFDVWPPDSDGSFDVELNLTVFLICTSTSDTANWAPFRTRRVGGTAAMLSTCTDVHKHRTGRVLGSLLKQSEVISIPETRKGQMRTAN